MNSGIRRGRHPQLCLVSPHHPSLSGAATSSNRRGDSRIVRLEDGQCIIGMERKAMLPLITFDLVVNVGKPLFSMGRTLSHPVAHARADLPHQPVFASVTE